MIELKTNPDEGYFLGDLLHKYAVKGSPTWQVAAFETGARPQNMSLPSFTFGSVLDLIDSRLVGDSISDAQGSTRPKIVQFRWNGERYAWNNCHLEGLNHILGDQFNAVVVYAFGQRTAEQNYESAASILRPNEMKQWTVVTSRHSVASRFRYTVEKRIDYDILRIDASRQSVESATAAALSALDAVSKSLQS